MIENKRLFAYENNVLNSSMYSAEGMQRFKELESSLIDSENALINALGEHASLKAFARMRIKAWANSAMGTSLEPDEIIVKSQYILKVGGREIVQDDQRSLTEFVIFGLHDQYARSSLAFEGNQVPTGLTRGRLEGWLANVDVRSDFAALWVHSPSQPVINAMQERMARHIEFSTFRHQNERYYQPLDALQINQYLAGASHISMSGIIFPNSGAPMKNMWVFADKRTPGINNILYAPQAPDGVVWRTFREVVELESHIVAWARQYPDFIDSHVISLQRTTAHQYMQEVISHNRQWRNGDVRLTAMQSEPGRPLSGAAASDLRWQAFEAISVAPAEYRRLPISVRQEFARLHTELAALYTVESLDVGFMSYEQFTYDLIKSRVEGVLQDRGEVVKVDPDKIIVELTPSEKMTLTSLMINEKHFDAYEREGMTSSGYPRYYVMAGHPVLKSLDIRDIANWTKLRPGEKYINMLKDRFLNPNDSAYTFRREVHFERQHTEMYRAALAERFSGGLTSDQFNRIKQLIISLEKSQAHLTHPLGDAPSLEDSVYRFHFGRRRPVKGVYVFRITEDWLYTPHAPDGKWFRPLDHIVNAIRYGALTEYFLDRVRLIDQPAVNEYFDAVRDIKRRTAAPGLEIGSRVRDIYTSYNDMVQFVIDDVDFKTTSLAEIISALVYKNVMLAATVISIVIPPVGLAASAVKITKSLLEGAQSWHLADRDAAFTSFQEALIELATLGYGKYEKLGATSVTKTQKTLIGFIKDARKVAEMVSTATGQKIDHELLKEIVDDVLAELGSGGSKTTVR
ncbi:hypothetical protein PSH97_04430 [Pseudomonas cucumis]|uniref:Uncharacterized protein n=1 Tax=Pseudomonas cucumis TaxID=2954082 RepID=A0ABY9EYN9_9PSED|nr:hypothetical protein [Pseudomonas cucumis]WLG85785.1 hypothetical protein PSH97_04430 [Pseudomonas cucumis]